MSEKGQGWKNSQDIGREFLALAAGTSGMQEMQEGVRLGSWGSRG